MRGSNMLVIRGRIARDFTLEQTQKGTSTCQLTVAVNRPRRKDAEEEADFIPVRIYGKSAEFVAQYFSKGDPISLAGELRVDQWTNQEGAKRSTIYLLAENVEFCGGKRSGEKHAPAAATTAPAPAPSQDYAVISDDDELPF